jgi:D-beta-D-heptose 7-phosphate kinase/D-beta-D-heptose 1-phosphate adenosyltransferase
MKVWVNGTFDVLHIGHMRLLEYASKFGTVRVGIDTDERVREKKGEDRPFNKLEERMEFMSGIKFVDSVVSFDSDESLVKCIKDWDTEILVIGNDYESKLIIGAEFVDRVCFFNKIENKSTSKILSHDRNSNW